MRTRREPKVHQYKRRRSRRIAGPGRTLLSVCVTLVVAGAVGVVGFSIARPILEMTGGRQHAEPSAETAAMVVLDETTSTTAPPATQAPTQAATSPGAAPLTTSGSGVVLPASALTDRQALDDALVAARRAAPTGNILVVPLKIQGGAIPYQTEVTLASRCGAIQGDMTLSEIITAITAAGWTPVAQVSLLYDNLLPDADSQAGYTIAETGNRWLDNKQENDGKPWVSPFSPVTLEYLTDLVAEISDSGVSQIWCCDVIFPAFRSTDLEYIGALVQDPGRGQALVQLVNTLAQTAGDVPVLLEEDAAAVLDGTSEGFDAQRLAVSGVVLDLETGTQAQTAADWMADRAPELPVWLSVSADAAPIELETLAAGNAQVYGWVYGASE